LRYFTDEKPGITRKRRGKEFAYFSPDGSPLKEQNELVRVFLVHHVTWSVNSACHLWGLRPFRSDDESRNNIVFGVLAMGEGWHNTHHAFPTSARHGLRWWEIDASYWVIRGLALFGLAWNLKLPSQEAQDSERRTA